jgi:N-acetylglucosamine-6-phosphate deacetylase
MARAVRNYARFTGAGLGQLAAVAATNPARLLGLSHRLGRIAVGAAADFAVLDRDLDVSGVMVGGQWLSPPGP